MIEVEIKPWMIDNALSLAKEMGTLKHSIRSGAGNFAGFLGEECVLERFPEARRSNDYHHDIQFRGFKIEVKTKERTKKPLDHYDVSISHYNTTQGCDFFFFVSLLKEKDQIKTGFILGYIKPAQFFEKAKLMRKGEVDTRNNFTVRSDCWNLEISQLHKFTRF